jgi:hypothetical protein
MTIFQLFLIPKTAFFQYNLAAKMAIFQYNLILKTAIFQDFFNQSQYKNSRQSHNVAVVGK